MTDYVFEVMKQFPESFINYPRCLFCGQLLKGDDEDE